jgi:hypothetical protein
MQGKLLFTMLFPPIIHLPPLAESSMSAALSRDGFRLQVDFVLFRLRSKRLLSLKAFLKSVKQGKFALLLSVICKRILMKKNNSVLTIQVPRNPLQKFEKPVKPLHWEKHNVTSFQPL